MIVFTKWKNIPQYKFISEYGYNEKLFHSINL